MVTAAIAGPRTETVKVRAWAQSHGGHATLFHSQDKSPGVFQPLPPAMFAIHKRLKAEFDPHGVLNPGRMFATI